MSQRKRRDSSPLLIDAEPLQVLPALAVAIGLNESIIVQQMHYWLRKREHVIDGVPWVYNSYVQWKRQFPFWSPDTIKRAIIHLEQLGVIRSANFNRNPIDKTKWYTINYARLNDFYELSMMQDASSTGQDASSTGQDASSTGQDASSTGQDAQLDDASCPHGQGILPSLPETSAERSTERETPSPPHPVFGFNPARAREESAPAAPSPPDPEPDRQPVVDTIELHQFEDLFRQPEGLHEQIQTVLDHLQHLTGRRYTSTQRIAACLRAGATVAECCHVLDWLQAVWCVEHPDIGATILDNDTPFQPEKFDKYRARAEQWHQQGRPPPAPRRRQGWSQSRLESTAAHAKSVVQRMSGGVGAHDARRDARVLQIPGHPGGGLS
jgi:hypothetical protein